MFGFGLERQVTIATPPWTPFETFEQLILTTLSISLPPDTWNPIRLLWNRPWFERLWVVQEALLARKATFSGQQNVDFDCFVYLKRVHMKYRRLPDLRLDPMQYNLSSPFSLALWDWSRLKEQLSQGGIPIFEMITTTGKMLCFLPVDNVYGILSVCLEIDRRVVKVNYHICVRCLHILVDTCYSDMKTLVHYLSFRPTKRISCKPFHLGYPVIPRAMARNTL
jgi:hypothetical protein